MPPNQIVEMANAGRLILPKNLTPVTRDLVKRILVPDPEVRLDIRDIMKHKFFTGVDWAAVERRFMDPPYVPPQDENHNLIEPVKMPGVYKPPGTANPNDIASDEGTLTEHQTTAATQIGNRVLQPALDPPQRKKVQSSLSTKSSP